MPHREILPPRTHGTLNVLIVDSNRAYRQILERCLPSLGGIQVKASVWNAGMAERVLKERKIHVVLLDMGLPNHGGLDALEICSKWNRTHPRKGRIGLIMLSGQEEEKTAAVVEALHHEATFDLMTKPDGLTEAVIRSRLIKELGPRLRHLRRVLQQQWDADPHHARETAMMTPHTKTGTTRYGVILVGSSTGGPNALNQFLPALCQLTHLPILLVQHMPPVFTASLADSLNQRCSHEVKEMQGPTLIRSQHVLVAPGGRHMAVDRDREGHLIVRPDDGPLENSCRPAVDVLFRTAAHFFGRRAVAVVLTGMGHDGTLGAAALNGQGAPLLVQDRESSVVWGMPGSIVESGLPCEVHALSALPAALQRVLYGGDVGP